MALIYEPEGKAGEYSPYALNIYLNGCNHACSYCYCPDWARRYGRPWTTTPTPRALSWKTLEREAEETTRQVGLSFLGDPYCAAEREYRATREALAVLAGARCSVAVLTKGGSRCLDDLDAFKRWPEGRVQVGATLTFLTESRSREVEPGAAVPEDRLAALQTLHAAGVRTWASIEPVIDADESLAVIEASLPFVAAYKVGKLNHEKDAVDWRAFAPRAVAVIRQAGRRVYVKVGSQPYFPAGFLTPQERDPESLFLPDRPEEPSLFGLAPEPLQGAARTALHRSTPTPGRRLQCEPH